MPDRKKGNVPSRRPPPRDPNRLYPPSDLQYSADDENPYAGHRPDNFYEGYDEHGFLLPENSSQQHAAESHFQGHTTMSRPRSYGTPPPPQQDNRLERPPLRRLNATLRHYDEETEDSVDSMINQNTGSRRSRRDNERRFDSTAENEQSALTVRSPTTVATRPPTDIVRRSDKKSRSTAKTSAPGVKISGGAGQINMSYHGNFDVNIKNDADAFGVTLRHRDDKSKGHPNKGRAIESSMHNRTTGRNRRPAIESSWNDQNIGWSRNKAIESSRGSQSSQPTGAQARDYYAILGCNIDDSAEEITRKGMNKEQDIFERGLRRMTRQQKEELDAEEERVTTAFYVLNDKDRRRAYDEKRNSHHGN